MSRTNKNRSLLEPRPVSVRRIISGGQTGVDRAALDAALALNIPCGGWCPRGRRAEDGRIPDRYPLKEADSASYSSRTVQNVRDSTGTLILAAGRLTRGTLLTRNTATRHKKPCLVVDLGAPADPDFVRAWLREHDIEVLNVAGPRASQAPRVHARALRFLTKLLSPA